MSTTGTVTETRRAGAPTSLSILADYEVHHTGTEEAPAPNTATRTLQPANWPSNHRRMPTYRPINRELDFNDRAAGASAGEFIFIQGMLHGVWLNAVRIKSGENTCP